LVLLLLPVSFWDKGKEGFRILEPQSTTMFEDVRIIDMALTKAEEIRT